MNIKIVDSWLREFLKTKAKPSDIVRELSLKSVSVEKVEKIEGDFVYDLEVTTNRVDLMSVEGIAREASATIKDADYTERKAPDITISESSFPIEIKNDPKLVNRICAAVLEVEVGKSPKEVNLRLENSGMRNLNNLIDVTNYVMREVGHPTHVFDFDKLTTKKMIIRQSKKGEIIKTLDNKTHTLLGRDIIADDGTGKIIDLLGVMGTANSVVSDKTKRILFFIDNNNPVNIRNTSMNLGIRSEAAILNEKGVDPELAMKALLRGIELFEKIANGKVVSKIFDEYPNKPKTQTLKVDVSKINRVIGVNIPPQKSVDILNSLGFSAKKIVEQIEVKIPTIRLDVKIDEDIIEEIARIYGYHNLPSIIPTFLPQKTVPFANNFYFEKRIKDALKYWGFTEVYAYSLVSEDMYEGPIDEAIKLKNPLSSDMVYLRNTLIPSLLKVEKENRARETLKIFEIANVYLKRQGDLPKEELVLAGLVKNPKVNFFEVKGIVEQILFDLGIKNLEFKKTKLGGSGASVFIGKDYVGEIEILDANLIDFEFNFNTILKYANVTKVYKPFAKFPPVVEDISVVADLNINTQDIIDKIESVDDKIVDVSLKDVFEDSRTFHITYQDFEKNMTKEEVGRIRKDIVEKLKEEFNASIKE